jgi:tetratricopeptide (TPR) repeat protein
VQPVSDVYAAALARLAGLRRPPNALQPIVASIQSGMLPLARFDLAARLDLQPDDADALHLLARVARMQDLPGEAISLLERCVAAAPGFLAARFDLASLLFKAERHADALRELDALLAREGDNAAFLRLKANVLTDAGDAQAAVVASERLVQLHALHPETWTHLGHAYRVMGQREPGIAAYRHATSLSASNGKAWWALANLKNYRFDDADLATLRTQVDRRDLVDDDRIPMQFALAKALEDRGDYREAFEHYDRANRASRATIEVDLDVLRKGVERSKTLFDAEVFADRARSGAGHPSTEPIFILGRQRSGSTLVEQILASHSAIEGTDELRYVSAIASSLAPGASTLYTPRYLDALLALDAAGLTALGSRYLEGASIHRRLGRPNFTDKKPTNYLHLGLIHLMLPRAKIIDVRRHPAASCFSSFKSYSTGGGLTLPELARMYRDYVDLMDHFDEVLAGSVHRVFFEDLIGDPEREIRRLLDYLELPFEPACLRFHETRRSVMTPSSEQVRRPITQEAVDHWRHFEPWLGSLLDSLGPALTDYPRRSGA